MGSHCEVELLPERRDEAVKAYNERGIPRIRASPGNIDGYLLEPTVEGEEFVACTLW